MIVTTYTWEEVQEKANRLAKKAIKEAVDWEISANNIKPKTKEWYLLEHLKQMVVEKANTGGLN